VTLTFDLELLQHFDCPIFRVVALSPNSSYEFMDQTPLNLGWTQGNHRR